MAIKGFERSFAQQATDGDSKKKGFWLDQLSTGGGIGGALGGAALGASVGSIVPGIGTVIGGLAGGVLGGALGSGGGELAENAITGDDLLKNVGQEALLGGVFSAPPLRAGKAIIGAGKALATGAGKEGAKLAAETALTKPGLISTALGKAGSSLGQTSDNLAVKQFRFTPTQLANYKAKFGEDVAKTIKKYGFDTADDIVKKGVNPLQEQFTNNIAHIGGISKQALSDSLQAKIAPLTKAVASDNKALGKQLQAEADQLLTKFGDEIDATELNAVRREFDSLVNYTQKVADPTRYGVNKRVADALRDTLQKSDPTGTLKNIGSELSKLRQLADNAAKQAELGRGSNPVSLTGVMGATAGAAGGGPVGAAAGFAATQAANSATGRRVITDATGSLSDALINAGGKSFNPTSAGGIAGRLGTLGAVKGIGTQLSDNAAMNTTANNSINPNTNMDSQYSNGGDLSSLPEGYTSGFGVEQAQPDTEAQSPYPKENLLYDLQRDPKNAAKYLEYYSQVQEVFGQQAGPKLNATQIQQANNANSGLSDLQNIYDSIQSDPTVLARNAIPGGSIARGLTGTTDFEASKQNVVDVISRLRSGAAITEDEAKRYMGLLPALGDSQQSAISKLVRLQSLLSGFSNPQAAQPDLTSALLQQQGGY